ncbi:MAG: hypothetical protein HY828_22120 [Actinobacteria bacterium]|nr:hypothetical protein [Actinomycetota bacterium]
MTDLTSLVRAGVDAHLPGIVDTERLLGGARIRARRDRVRTRALLVSAAAVVAAASATVWTGAAQPVVAALGGPGTIVETPCPSDVGFCGPSYTFAGRPYDGPGCLPVRPEVVSDDVIARGRIGGQRTEVRRVTDVDPALLVAVRLPTTGCDEVDRTPSEWSLALATPPDARDAVRQRDVHRAVCGVVLPRDRAGSRCGGIDVRSVLDAEAPVVGFEPDDWPADLVDIECDPGTVRFRAHPPGPGDGDGTADAATDRLSAAVVNALSAPAAARTSTIAYREIREGGNAQEIGFFRGDGRLVAVGKVIQSVRGRWYDGGYVGCAPNAAVPAGANIDR